MVGSPFTSKMKDLPIKDKIHANAADGWISLGDLTKAKAELAEISPEFQDHPDVIQVRWHVAATAAEWDSCIEIAAELTHMTPERSFGWMNLALSLRRLNRFQDAVQVLRQGIEQCGETPTLEINLACCHARLGSVSWASKSLKRAFELVLEPQDRNCLLLRALGEEDLEPVWRADGARIARSNRSTQVEQGLFPPPPTS